MPPPPTPASIAVRIETASGKILGSGFLVSDNHVMTCAHVAGTKGADLRSLDQGEPAREERDVVAIGAPGDDRLA